MAGGNEHIRLFHMGMKKGKEIVIVYVVRGGL